MSARVGAREGRRGQRAESEAEGRWANLTYRRCGARKGSVLRVVRQCRRRGTLRDLRHIVGREHKLCAHRRARVRAAQHHIRLGATERGRDTLDRHLHGDGRRGLRVVPFVHDRRVGQHVVPHPVALVVDLLDRMQCAAECLVVPVCVEPTRAVERGHQEAELERLGAVRLGRTAELARVRAGGAGVAVVAAGAVVAGSADAVVDRVSGAAELVVRSDGAAYAAGRWVGGLVDPRIESQVA